MLGEIIGAFIVILVGSTLLPVVANQIAAAQGGNVTGAASTIVGLTTLFYSLALMSVGAAAGVSALRKAGLM
jgi:hypothetical protein